MRDRPAEVAEIKTARKMRTGHERVLLFGKCRFLPLQSASLQIVGIPTWRHGAGPRRTPGRAGQISLESPIGPLAQDYLPAAWRMERQPVRAHRNIAPAVTYTA